MRHFAKFVFLILIQSIPRVAFCSDDAPVIKLIDVQPRSEIWLNAGMYSYHFDQHLDYNNNNFGFGIEYVFSSIASLTTGRYKNSEYGYSNYLGIYYHPIEIGAIKLGAVMGFINGYADTYNGGIFPALIPTITVEYGRLGANILLIPTIGSTVNGAISVQLKVKVWN